MNDRVPPMDTWAEVCLLGSMLLGADLDDVREVVCDTDFYTPANQTLFRAICWLGDHDRGVNLVTLKTALSDRNQLDAVGGMEYVTALVDGVPTWEGWRDYADSIARNARKRDLISATLKATADAYDPSGNPEDILETLGQVVYDLDPATKADGGVVAAGDAVRHVLHGPLRKRVPTGFLELDTAMGGGFGEGHYIVLAGTTSSGKTSLALCIARNVCRAGHGVLLVSLEMGKDEIAVRLAAVESNVFCLKIDKRTTDQRDALRLEEAEREIARWRMPIDTRAATVPAIVRGVRRMARKGKVGLVVVDYLQLMDGQGMGRYDIFTRISRDLKIAAGNLAVPFLVLSQLHRPPSADEKWRPHVRSLKESGGIENDADAVLLLYRPSTETPNPCEKNEVWLRVAKQRNGMTTAWPDSGSGIILDWTPALTKFEGVNE